MHTHTHNVLAWNPFVDYRSDGCFVSMSSHTRVRLLRKYEAVDRVSPVVRTGDVYIHMPSFAKSRHNSPIGH